jgi:hypothetical protein
LKVRGRGIKTFLIQREPDTGERIRTKDTGNKLTENTYERSIKRKLN